MNRLSCIRESLCLGQRLSLLLFRLTSRRGWRVRVRSEDWDCSPTQQRDSLTPGFPGEFVLGATFELVTLPTDIAARLEGKSSLGRLGLLTHSTAGFIDPGFSGHVTLELSNVATLPIKLWPGMKIGQLCFFRLSSAAENPYGSTQYSSRYQGQRGPTASRSFQNFHRTDVGGP